MECRTPLESGRDFRCPTRILEICKESVVLRKNVTKMHYACLSHCWGNPKEICQTRRSNIGKPKDDLEVHTGRGNIEKSKDDLGDLKVPLDALTTTFQDAVKICQSLKIEYVWIDSLCIIQNSPEDWENEAARMADIYENAHITIAATKSESSAGGCYSDIPEKYIARPIPGYQNAFARVQLPALPSHWEDFGRQKELPLFNRGWIYQEMRLSHRVLHYCAHEVIWACRRGTVRQKESESKEPGVSTINKQLASRGDHVADNDVNGHVNNGVERNLDEEIDPDMAQEIQHESNHDAEHDAFRGDTDDDVDMDKDSSSSSSSIDLDVCVKYHDISYQIPSERPDLLWYRVVSEYSGLQLTKTDEDRMNALAGIVKRIQNHHRRGRYLIGLWEKSLILDLCWERGLISPLQSRRKSRYPSWSWASIHTHVIWGDNIENSYVPLATIASINVVYEGPDNLGNASKSSMSSITIEAPVLKFKVVYASDGEGEPEVMLTEAEGIVAWRYNPDFIMPRVRKRTGYLVVLCGKQTGACMAIHVQKRRKRGVDVYERVGHVSLLKGSFEENEDVLLRRREIKDFWSILPKPSVLELV